MQRSIVHVGLVVSCALAACSTNVPATNRFDPAGSGEKAPGRVRGALYVEGLIVQAGIAVHVRDKQGSEADVQNTDADGAFVSRDLAPGVYTLTADVPPENLPIQREVTLEPGLVADVGTLVSAVRPADGVIRGQVTLEQTVASPAGVRVIASRVTHAGTTESLVQYTDGAGAFAFVGVVPGAYQLRAERESFTPAWDQIVVAASTRATSDAPPMHLYPASAVVRFSVHTASGDVIGAPYTSTRAVDALLLAFGGVNEMRLSEAADFVEGGSEVAWRDHVAEVPMTLSAGEGEKHLYAQFRVVDAQGQELLRTDVYEAQVVFDETPPLMSDLSIAPGATEIGGQSYLSGAVTAVPLHIDAVDALSTVAGVRIVLEGADPATVPYRPVLSMGPVLSFDEVVSLSASDGAKTIRVQLRDGAGNESTLVSKVIVVDNTPPVAGTVTLGGVVRGDAPSTSWTRSPLVSVKLAGSSDASGLADMQLSNVQTFVGAAWVPYADSLDWILAPGDGVKQVWVRVRDRAGNVSAAVAGTIALDTTPPIVGLTLTGSIKDGTPSGVLTGTQTVTVALDASDGGGMGALEMTLDGDITDTFKGQPTAFAATKSVTLSAAVPATGQRKSVTATVRDGAGNVAAVATASILLDSAYDFTSGAGKALRLEPTAGGAGERDYVSAVSTTVWVKPDGSGDGVELQLVEDPNLDGNDTCEPAMFSAAVWQPVAVYTTFLLTAGDGVKAVCFRSRDLAGNTTDPTSSTIIARDTVILDTIAPTAPRIANAPVVTQADSVSVSLSVEATDAHGVSYEVTGGQYDTWTGVAAAPWTINLGAPTDGIYNIGVRAKDPAGNVSGQDFLTVVRDTTAPGLPLHQGLRGAVGAWGSADVDAGDGFVAVSWEPPADADVGGYYVYYGFVGGTDPSLYTGQFANEGRSPINVGAPCSPRANGNDCSFRLTGLENGTTIYVTVAAYDRTESPRPNLGAIPTGVAIAPNLVVPALVDTVSVASLGASGVKARGVQVLDDLAYVTTGGNGTNGRLSVIDVSEEAPQRSRLVGVSAAVLTDGYEVYVHGGYAYVADGASGLVTFDVTDPTAPARIGTDAIAANLRAEAVAGQKDIIYVATTNAVAGQSAQIYAYSINGGGCGGTPSNPCQIGTWTNGDRSYYDVAIQGPYAYVAAFEDSISNNPVYVLNVTTGAPTLAGSLATADSWPLSVSISGRYLYVQDFFNTRVLDVSNPAAPVEKSRIGAPHSKTVLAHGGYAYTLSPTAGLIVQSITASESAATLSAVGVARSTSEVDGGNYNPIPGDLAARGNYVYAAAGDSGLQIFRLTAARSVKAESTVPGTAPNQSEVLVAGNELVYCDSTDVLRAIHVNPTIPADRGTGSSVSGSAQALAIDGDLVLAGAWSNGSLSGRRLSAGASAFTVDGNYVPGTTFEVYGLAVRWPYAYLAGSTTASRMIPDRLRVIDLRTYTQAGEISFTPGAGTYMVGGRLALFGKYAYVTNNNLGVEIFDISTPTSPVRLAPYSASEALQIVVSGRRAYLSLGSGFRVLDLATPASPVDLGGASISGGVRGLFVSGRYAYFASGWGLALYDASLPTAVGFVGISSALGTPIGVTAASDLMFGTEQGTRATIVRVQ